MSRPLAAPEPQDPSPEPVASTASISLAKLAPGQSAVVASVEDDSPIGRRLLDLGFRPGTRLRVGRRAPLGDPTIYELRGSRFCLRRSEAARVRVVPSPDAPPR